MIKLSVEGYCQECDGFEAETSKLVADNECLFYVQCVNRDRCEVLRRRILEELGVIKKEEKNEDAKD